MNDEEDIQDIENRGSGLASLTQLVAKGPDSDYIHKDATAYLFEGQYFKHTPFIVSHESFISTVEFDKTYRFTIPFKGKLLLVSTEPRIHYDPIIQKVNSVLTDWAK